MTIIFHQNCYHCQVKWRVLSMCSKTIATSDLQGLHIVKSSSSFGYVSHSCPIQKHSIPLSSHVHLCASLVPIRKGRQTDWHKSKQTKNASNVRWLTPNYSLIFVGAPLKFVVFWSQTCNFRQCEPANYCFFPTPGFCAAFYSETSKNNQDY